MSVVFKIRFGEELRRFPLPTPITLAAVLQTALDLFGCVNEERDQAFLAIEPIGNEDPVELVSDQQLHRFIDICPPSGNGDPLVRLVLTGFLAESSYSFCETNDSIARPPLVESSLEGEDSDVDFCSRAPSVVQANCAAPTAPLVTGTSTTSDNPFNEVSESDVAPSTTLDELHDSVPATDSITPDQSVSLPIARTESADLQPALSEVQAHGEVIVESKTDHQMQLTAIVASSNEDLAARWRRTRRNWQANIKRVSTRFGADARQIYINVLRAVRRMGGVTEIRLRLMMASILRTIDTLLNERRAQAITAGDSTSGTAIASSSSGPPTQRLTAQDREDIESTVVEMVVMGQLSEDNRSPDVVEEFVPSGRRVHTISGSSGDSLQDEDFVHVDGFEDTSDDNASSMMIFPVMDALVPEKETFDTVEDQVLSLRALGFDTDLEILRDVIHHCQGDLDLAAAILSDMQCGY